MRLPSPLLSLLLVLMHAPAAQAGPAPERALVFTRTVEYGHESIPAAVAALQRVATAEGMQADHSENAADFTAANLARYRVVVFASTTGDVLDDQQQAALEGFIRGGGGFVGLHAAADTEYDWPWYGRLVGAYFHSHPPGLQTSRVQPERDGRVRGAPWAVHDELYNYRDTPRGRVQVVATVDERLYDGGRMGSDHPITWCHPFDGGRSWYTGLGHDEAMYRLPAFVAQVRQGLRYAAGRSAHC
ncbi:ThuA domain-containing protein [Stenotrophomonas sp. GZD-301]|uniref:ThuA domain-containing protein n=1 Tax=Stenotrophomonas sp. GZD-301 TaxID=3404814 RepID=UPI003BB7656A